MEERGPQFEAVRDAVAACTGIQGVDVVLSTDKQGFNSSAGREVWIDFDEVEIGVPYVFDGEDGNGNLVEFQRGDSEIGATLQVRSDDHRQVPTPETGVVPGWAHALALQVKRRIAFAHISALYEAQNLALNRVEDVSPTPGDERDQHQLSISILRIVFNHAWCVRADQTPGTPAEPETEWFDHVAFALNDEPEQNAVKGAQSAEDIYPGFPLDGWKHLWIGSEVDVVGRGNALPTGSATLNQVSSFPRSWITGSTGVVGFTNPFFADLNAPGTLIFATACQEVIPPPGARQLIRKVGSGIGDQGWIVFCSADDFFVQVFGSGGVSQSSIAGFSDGVARVFALSREGSNVVFRGPGSVTNFAVQGSIEENLIEPITIGEPTASAMSEFGIFGWSTRTDSEVLRLQVASSIGIT